MNKKGIEAAALSIRALSMDAVQAANSGHPGLPMGCAELGAVLYGDVLKHYPGDPSWIDRDRFVLSAGHGSAFLYSLLHLSGYGLTLDDLKNFRQMGSLTPGHPEYGHTIGVETTTGPLGAGFSNAVGMALAEAFLAAKFNTAEHTIIDHYTYALSGDGCMMEGITSESASLAGHLKLGKLIVFYDSNSITIEGGTSLAFSEDVAARFKAYGWHVQSGDMYDPEGVEGMINKAKSAEDQPSLIILKSVIGKGSPHKAGTSGIHGAPLGDEEIKETRRNLGIPENESFYIAPGAKEFFDTKNSASSAEYKKWQETFLQWADRNPELKKEWDAFFSAPDVSAVQWPSYSIGDSVATRKASGAAIKAASKVIGNLVGGSADLAPSNNTAMDFGDFSAGNKAGRTLHFGVREHAMGGITNGIALHGGLVAFSATFLVFSDYMRPAMRLAALMKLPVVFIMTHDSVFVGEDGPTHQPVEHVSSLRMIPGMRVFRPADGEETNAAWEMALSAKDHPATLALTRQGLKVFKKADSSWEETIKMGAYIARDTDGDPDAVIVATGSEVNLALAAAEKSDKKVRVVSMMSRELFMEQSSSFRKSIIPDGVKTVVVEAGVRTGWEGIATSTDDILSIDTFGISAPYKDVVKHFGFTVENVLKML